MKKKLILSILCVCLLFCFTACGDKTDTSSTDDSSSESEYSEDEIYDLSPDDLDISDYEWNVEERTLNGTDYYAFDFTNDTWSDILGVEIIYRLRDDLDEDELATFKPFMKKHKDWISDDLKITDVMLRADTKKLIRQEKSKNNMPLAIGIGNYTWTDIPTEEQFEMFEPSELSMGYIDSGTTLYMVTYDIQSEKWSIGDHIDLNEWCYLEIGDKVPEPEGEVYYHIEETETDDEESFTGDVYGVSKKYFNNYVKRLKKNGFTRNVDAFDGYFKAKNKHGDEVKVDYNSGSGSFGVSAEAKLDY